MGALVRGRCGLLRKFIINGSALVRGRCGLLRKFHINGRVRWSDGGGSTALLRCVLLLRAAVYVAHVGGLRGDLLVQPLCVMHSTPLVILAAWRARGTPVRM
jgi:hypothetical protein